MANAHFSPKAVIKDAAHFRQHSTITTGKTTQDTSATHSVSLDLQSPEVKAAARQMFLQDAALVSNAVAEYPELVGYLEELGVPLPPAGQQPPARMVPVLDGDNDDAEIDPQLDEPEETGPGQGTVVPDSLLRITTSSLDAREGGRYSMLVAVTQAALNAQLFYRWADLDRPEFQTMVCPPAQFEHGESVDADMAAPQMALQVVEGTAQTRGSVLLYLNFLGGVCRVWDTETNSLAEADDTLGWKFVLDVDLQLVDLDDSSAEYREVASTHDVPADYGISALVAELGTARLSDRTWGLSSFGSFDMKPSRRTSFEALVTAWLGTLAMSIGYSLVDRSGFVDAPDPTVPPTSQVLQTYPSRKTRRRGLVQIHISAPVQGLGPVGDNNMLLYLGMTKGRSMPDGGLPWTANWVPNGLDNSPTAGCLAISHEDVLDTFLIPRLAILNRATYFEMTEAHTNKAGAAKADYRFNVGRNPLPDSAFDWTKSVSGTGTRYTWTWTGSKSDKDGRRGFESRAAGRTSVTNTLVITPGTSRIRWQTAATLRYETSLETFWINNKGVASARRDGETDIVLDSVLDGKIGMRILMPDGWVTASSTGSNSFGFGGTNMAQMASRLKGQYFNEDNIEGVVKSVNKRLERDFAFVLPGGGTFLMKTPVFNNDLDLLVDLTYNGAQ